MTTIYDRRITALELRHNPAPIPRVRVIHTIISPDREIEGVYLCGQHFDRADGESENELEQRAMRGVSWDD